MVRSGELPIHRSRPCQASPWMEFRPEANVLVASATPSRLASIRMTTVSPGVSGLGFRYCGPCPTNSRPRASNAMALGLRTMGSRAKSSTFNSEGTVGSAGTAAG